MPGRNSYLVGKTEGRNVLDSIRAAFAFRDVHLRPGALIAGQSQGGHAALFAGELSRSYAPELRIIGVVAQAPLEAMFRVVLSAGKRGGIVSLLVMAADAYTRTTPR